MAATPRLAQGESVTCETRITTDAVRDTVGSSSRCTIAAVLETVTVDTFRPLIGSAFRIVVAESSWLEAELEAVESAGLQAAGAARAAGRREPFSIVFRGPAEPVLPQRIYRLEHTELGELELFLVPIAQDADGTRYEAVFA